MEFAVILIIVIVAIVFISKIFRERAHLKAEEAYKKRLAEEREKRSFCPKCGEQFEDGDVRYNYSEQRYYVENGDPTTIYTFIATCHKCKERTFFGLDEHFTITDKVRVISDSGVEYTRKATIEDVIEKYFNCAPRTSRKKK